MMVYFPQTPTLEKLHKAYGLNIPYQLAIMQAKEEINNEQNNKIDTFCRDEIALLKLQVREAITEAIDRKKDSYLKIIPTEVYKLNQELTDAFNEYETIVEEITNRVLSFNSSQYQITLQADNSYLLKPIKEITMIENRIYSIPHNPLMNLLSSFVMPCISNNGIVDQSMVVHYVKTYLKELAHIFIERMVNDTPENLSVALLTLRDDKQRIPYYNQIPDQNKESYLLGIYLFITQLQTCLIHSGHYYEKCRLNAYCSIDELSVHYLNISYIYNDTVMDV